MVMDFLAALLSFSESSLGFLLRWLSESWPMAGVPMEAASNTSLRLEVFDWLEKTLPILCVPLAVVFRHHPHGLFYVS
jgi:hypothetical protein